MISKTNDFYFWGLPVTRWYRDIDPDMVDYSDINWSYDRSFQNLPKGWGAIAIEDECIE